VVTTGHGDLEQVLSRAFGQTISHFPDRRDTAKSERD
jgi:hypothetical protein